MVSEQFFVSVIVPVYNGEKFLTEAIENIQRQNYYPLEIIVVDDGSTDRTAAIAAQFRQYIRYIHQPNRGPAAARNTGIRMAKGNVLAFLDIDDLWSNHKLQLQINYLADNPSVDIVQGLIQQMRLSTVVDQQLSFEHSYHPYNFVNLGSAIYRKLVFEKVGLFDETLDYGEDVDWFIRAWEKGISKIVLNQVTLFYRKHKTNMTAGKNIVELGFVKIFKRHLDRCRQRGLTLASPLPQMPKINEYLGAPPEAPKIG